MAFPAEFQYANEDDFIQRLIVPLLQRLGFFIVVNTHGKREFGRDLVFAELDRFGHVRYNGLQAKYKRSVSLNESTDLIRDCRQAFNNPFRHPHTGTHERIGTFYMVNGGSFSDEARDNYFSSLPEHAANIRLLDGKTILMLDQSAAYNRLEQIGPLLTGLLLEVRFNANCVRYFTESLGKIPSIIPTLRLRLSATSNYLVQPLLPETLGLTEINNYWQVCCKMNNAIDAAWSLKITTQGVLQALNEMVSSFEECTKYIESRILPTLEALGSSLMVMPSVRQLDNTEIVELKADD